MPQPLPQQIECVVSAKGEHLDPAIRQIFRMPGQLQPQRLLARTGAKENALHLAADEEARRRHHLPPITLLSRAGVMGPTNFFATVPSGAITQVVGKPRGSSKSFSGLSSVTCATG